MTSILAAANQHCRAYLFTWMKACKDHRCAVLCHQVKLSGVSAPIWTHHAIKQLRDLSLPRYISSARVILHGPTDYILDSCPVLQAEHMYLAHGMPVPRDKSGVPLVLHNFL